MKTKTVTTDDVEIEIVKEDDFLHITFSGPFSTNAARGSVDMMVAACTRERSAKVLFDCRPMTGDMSELDRFDVAEYGGSTIPYFVKVAMLARIDQISPDNFFENVARNRGVTVTVFAEYDKAVAWLKDNGPPSTSCA